LVGNHAPLEPLARLWNGDDTRHDQPAGARLGHRDGRVPAPPVGSAM
jgi:hypothetical protein